MKDTVTLLMFLSIILFAVLVEPLISILLK